jgi:hypothetical protein
MKVWSRSVEAWLALAGVAMGALISAGTSWVVARKHHEELRLQRVTDLAERRRRELLDLSSEVVVKCHDLLGAALFRTADVSARTPESVAEAEVQWRIEVGGVKDLSQALQAALTAVVRLGMANRKLGQEARKLYLASRLKRGGSFDFPDDVEQWEENRLEALLGFEACVHDELNRL